MSLLIVRQAHSLSSTIVDAIGLLEERTHECYLWVVQGVGLWERSAQPRAPWPAASGLLK